jgi:tol-pal system protein YbgF
MLLVLLPCIAGLATACAGPGAETRPGEGETRLERLLQAQQRLELRMDEVTRNVLALRERMDAQEEALKALAEAERAQATEPPPPVLKEEPLPPEPEAKRVPDETAQPHASAPDPAADLYRRAFAAFRERRYGQAILDFEDFLRRHPRHDYADSAQYWIGESYYSQGEYEQSAVEFSRLLERYPNGSRAPDALLKVGLCYEKKGDREKALVFWKRLLAQHPGSEAAHQARTLVDEQRRPQ